ncbi:hypothetical protein ACROYT_G018827 [Oculina patagonica]
MPKLFRKKKKPYNSRSQKKLYGTSRPKLKIDVSVEGDLPFDEEDIAPELRREQITREEARPDDADPINKTSLEPVDISVEPSPEENCTSLSDPPIHFQRDHCSRAEDNIGLENQDTSESESEPDEPNTRKPEKENEKREENTAENGLEAGGKQIPVTTTPGKSYTSNTFSAGGQQVPVITSPADFYTYFPQRLNYNEDLPEELNSEEHLNLSDKPDTSSDTDSDDFPRTFDKKKFRESANTTTGTMQAEALTQLQKQMDLLQQELVKQEERSREFRQQTMNAFEQTPIPDTTSSHRPPAFHGFDSEDINRWLDKVENYLKLRRINTTTPTALAELVLNLAGPAEDFYYSLAEDRKNTFNKLRDALRERYANENQNWIIWQAITTRQQGPVESLDTYLNDLTSKFRRINISDADKMRYFVQGLRADLRETVLLKQPKSFQEAEDMARFASAVKTTMNNSSETMATQLTNLAKSLNTMATDTNSPTNTSELQALQTQMDVLTNKLDSLTTLSPKKETVAAYSTPENEELRSLRKMVQELTEAMTTLDRRVDARINGVVQREREYRVNPQRTRDGRPVCFNCGTTGHVQSACPQRRLREQRPVPRNALSPPPNMERDRYQPDFLPRRPAFGPPGNQSRIAALTENWYHQDNYMAPTEMGDDYDGEWDYYYDYKSDDEWYEQPRDWESLNQVEFEYFDNQPCMGSYRYVNKDQSAVMTHHWEGTTRPTGDTPLKQKQANPVKEVRAKEIVPLFKKKVVPGRGRGRGRDQEPTNARNREFHPKIGAVVRPRNGRPKNRSSMPQNNPVVNFVPPQNNAPAQENLSQSACMPKPVVANQSDVKCPQPNEVFSQNPRATSNYGSGLAVRTNPPGSFAPREEPYVNASTDCAENKPKHKVRDVHRHARKQRKKHQERTNLPGLITEARNEKITVSATKPKEDQKQKVNRQERISRQEQSQPKHVPGKHNRGIKSDVHKPTVMSAPSKKTTAKLNISDFTLVGDIKGQSIEFLVDTGACVSAIDEQIVKKIYGRQPAKMTDGIVPSVKTIAGSRMPVLGKIEVPVKLNAKGP